MDDRRSAGAFRSAARSADPGAADSITGAGVRTAADAAPYCVRRLVNGDTGAGVGNVVRGIRAWGGESSGAARDPVSGLCGVAAGVVERRAAAEAERVLAGGAGGCTGAAGVADGPAAAGAAEFCRGIRADWHRQGSDPEAEGTEPSARRHLIYDVAGSLGGGVVAVVGAGGSGDRDAGGEPWAGGDGEVNRAFCKHAGAAH